MRISKILLVSLVTVCVSGLAQEKPEPIQPQKPKPKPPPVYTNPMQKTGKKQRVDSLRQDSVKKPSGKKRYYCPPCGMG